MKLSSIVIMNVHTRRNEGRYLQKVIGTSASRFGIPVLISYDDGSLGLWKNYSQALTMPVGNEGTHRMVVHDDIIFDRNILEKILLILEHCPEDNIIISFYNPTNGDYTSCSGKGRHVLKTDTNFWLQACVYPETVIPKFLSFIDEKAAEYEPYDDSRLKAYLQYSGTFLYAIVPSLVQHLGAFRSNFKQGGMINGIPRYSSTYDNQFDVESVDWEEEFRNPYVARMKVDFVKQCVREEFLKTYGGKL